jgi:drug/metabolite transporter (DMT)-like permease
MRPRVLGVWCTACLLWSSTYLFIKLGLRDVPPVTFAWVRLSIALAVLVPITAARGEWRTLTRRDIAHVMGAGVLLLGLNYGLLYWGAQYTPSGLVAILQSATPVIALGLGSLLGSEQVTVRKAVSLTVGIVGVALIFRTEASASGAATLFGAIAVVCSSVSIAFAYVWLKRYGRRLPPTSVTTLQCVAGICVLAPAGLILEGSPAQVTWSPAAIGAVLYLALCGSVLAFWLNYWLLERMDASAMLMMGVAEVPVAVALGAMVFGERLPAGTFLGAACVLVSVIGALFTKSTAADSRTNVLAP